SEHIVTHDNRGIAACFVDAGIDLPDQRAGAEVETEETTAEPYGFCTLYKDLPICNDRGAGSSREVGHGVSPADLTRRYIYCIEIDGGYEEDVAGHLQRSGDVGSRRKGISMQ